MPKNLPAPAAKIKRLLNLKPSAEGVYIKHVHESAAAFGGRPAMTTAYALAAANAPSRLHRLDCDEVWHFYAGHPLSVYLLGRTGFKRMVLGPALAEGQMPLIAIPGGTIFGALAHEGEWCLFGCTCSPGFAEAGCEIIPAEHPALRAAARRQGDLLKALTGGAAHSKTKSRRE